MRTKFNASTLKTEQSEEQLALFLPKGIFEHLAIVSFETDLSGKQVYDKSLELTLEEKNIIPSEYKSLTYKSSGFIKNFCSDIWLKNASDQYSTRKYD